jgi:prefoldin subunit 5
MEAKEQEIKKMHKEIDELKKMKSEFDTIKSVLNDLRSRSVKK